MHYEYLAILIFLFIISVYLKVHYKLKFFKNTKQMIYFYIIFYLVGIFWDNFAVWRGHWYYPGKGILGIFIGYIPLEDYLFVFVLANFGIALFRMTEKYVK